MKHLLGLGLLLLFPGWADAGEEGWVIAARDTLSDYYAAAMANGEIGVTVNRELFSQGAVILGGAFESGSRSSVARILEGINPLGLSMTLDGRKVDSSEIRPEGQWIDMRRAVHVSRYRLEGVSVTCRVRALRNMPYALMTEVEVTADRRAEVSFVNRHVFPAAFADTLRESRKVVCEDGSRILLQRSSGRYNDGRDRMVASSTMLCGEGFEPEAPDGAKVLLQRGQTASFALVGTVCTTADFSDPWNESEREVIYAAREGASRLVEAHERLWARLWRSDIVIEGDPEAQRNVRFALFNLYGSIREGSRRSIPPMGLSARGIYNGHVFWDVEIWIYPALLVLRPELARQMLDYRIDGLAAARLRARAHGFRGAMFPWEGDARGEESTPTFALTGSLEHHITADIAIACWNYYCVTRDLDWLRREGFPLMREAAQFWCDRVSGNADGSYSIHNVIGADEYAVGVTDNAFTNGAVRRALEYAAAAAKLCGERCGSEWRKIAAGLRILHFPDGVTREHAAYGGERIKQADVNLLGYPLGLVTGREAQLRDMAYYEPRIDPQHGPAMSWSVFAVQYARLGMAAEAEAMFRRSYLPNLRPPFGVFAETAASGNPYFMTGAGGMLQAVLFGFGGLEITSRGLVQRKSVLPEHWKSLEIRTEGRCYRVGSR